MPSSTQSPTRRRLLRAAAALVGAGVVAGCGGSASSSSSVSSAPNADPPDDALTDPSTVALRAPEDVTVLRDGATETDASGDIRTDEWKHDLVADAETAASVSIAGVEGGDAARRLLDGTDFETETVYVERHVVGECYEHQLCWVRWTDEEVETSYARVLRDADVSCSADARVGVTHLLRLPTALDPDQVGEFSSGSRSGVCRSRTERDGTEVEP